MLRFYFKCSFFLWGIIPLYPNVISIPRYQYSLHHSIILLQQSSTEVRRLSQVTGSFWKCLSWYPASLWLHCISCLLQTWEFYVTFWEVFFVFCTPYYYVSRFTTHSFRVFTFKKNLRTVIVSGLFCLNI